MPTGRIDLELKDGAIGSTPLSRADAFAEVGQDKRLVFRLHVQPSGAPGELHLQGSIPLNTDGNLEEDHDEDDKRQSFIGSLLERIDKIKKERLSSSPKRNDAIEVNVVVKDNGMKLLTALSPEIQWKHGQADISMGLSGTFKDPHIAGELSG